MNKNTSALNTSKSEIPQNAEEAFLSIQIIASFKQNSLKINKNDQIVTIYHRHERILHLLFYLIILSIPFFMIKDTLKVMYPMLFVYFLLFILLVWNITRGTKGIQIDREKRMVKYFNIDLIGKLLHPSKTFRFDDIEDFSPTFESGRFGNYGKNMVLLKTKSSKFFPLFKIQSEGAGLTNGKLLCNSLKVLCE